MAVTGIVLSVFVGALIILLGRILLGGFRRYRVNREIEIALENGDYSRLISIYKGEKNPWTRTELLRLIPVSGNEDIFLSALTDPCDEIVETVLSSAGGSRCRLFFALAIGSYNVSRMIKIRILNDFEGYGWSFQDPFFGELAETFLASEGTLMVAYRNNDIPGEEYENEDAGDRQEEQDEEFISKKATIRAVEKIFGRLAQDEEHQRRIFNLLSGDSFPHFDWIYMLDFLHREEYLLRLVENSELSLLRRYLASLRLDKEKHRDLVEKIGREHLLFVKELERAEAEKRASEEELVKNDQPKSGLPDDGYDSGGSTLGYLNRGW